MPEPESDGGPDLAISEPGRPAERAAPAPRGPNKHLLPSRAVSAVVRVLLAMAGLMLAVGFFLPWVNLGKLVSVSGLGLITTGGEAVDLVSGPHRVLPLVIPLLGALLVAGAALGHPIVLYAGVGSGVLVLGYGMYTLVKFFFSTTGVGIWVIVTAALIALGVGLLAIGARRAQKRPVDGSL